MDPVCSGRGFFAFACCGNALELLWEDSGAHAAYQLQSVRFTQFVTPELFVQLLGGRKAHGRLTIFALMSTRDVS